MNKIALGKEIFATYLTAYADIRPGATAVEFCSWFIWLFYMNAHPDQQKPLRCLIFPDRLLCFVAFAKTTGHQGRKIRGEKPGCSSAWFRALGSGPRGRRFKSCHPD
jgi:hypothetical protein